MEITEDKKMREVATQFGKAASVYHQEANIQRKVSEGLISSLRPWKAMLSQDPILEVGCGTGFLTAQLLEEFPDHEMVITDASEEMLMYCKERLEKKGLITDKIQFELLDADTFEAADQKFSMIISNFAAQWFQDTAMALEQLSKALLPGGLLLCSFPGNHSFEEWYQHCLELGLPYTANPLPDVEEVVVKLSMGPMQIDYYENDLTQEFESSIDFLKHIKRIGAGYNIKGNSLNPKQLRLLTNHWDNQSKPIKIKWHVVYLAAKKDL